MSPSSRLRPADTFSAAAVLVACALRAPATDLARRALAALNAAATLFEHERDFIGPFADRALRWLLEARGCVRARMTGVPVPPSSARSSADADADANLLLGFRSAGSVSLASALPPPPPEFTAVPAQDGLNPVAPDAITYDSLFNLPAADLHSIVRRLVPPR